MALEAGDSLRIATVLKRLPQDLDTLRVTGQAVSLVPARFTAFERRRQLGRGTFITPEQLERTSPKQVHAIEVYSGPATMPPELVPMGRDAFCGILALWTK